MDFDYKKYSLQKLEEWVHDAISTSEATPQEIYDVIKNVVDENYHIHKLHASRCYELLALLNGNGKGHLSCDRDDPSPECKKSWNEFWENDTMPPWGHSDIEALQYTEEELNAMCDKAASDQEKEKCREYNLREAEYYDKRAQLDMTYDEMIAAGYEMTADGFWWPPQSPLPPQQEYLGWTNINSDEFDKMFPKKDKVKKWILPVEEAKDVDTDKTDYFVSFPDDLLKAADLKEGDQVRWVDNGDGSYTITKVTKPLGMDEC
jgi:hypothetical protein